MTPGAIVQPLPRCRRLAIAPTPTSFTRPISASCAAGPDLSLTATTSKADSSIYSSFDDVENDVILGNDLETQDFDVADSYDMLLGDTTGTQDPSLLTFVYDAPDGSVVTGSLSTDNSDGGPDACSVTGMVDAG